MNMRHTKRFSVIRPDGHFLAGRRLNGHAPGIVFVHGMFSSQNALEAGHIEGWCRGHGLAFAAYDQFAHGESSGRTVDMTISRLVEDMVCVLEEQGKRTGAGQILVASSIGGWAALSVARSRPDLVAGIIALAPAVDFTEFIRRLWMTTEDKQRLKEEGIYLTPPGVHESVPLGKAAFEDGKRHLLLVRPKPAIVVPVHILHGNDDSVVPLRLSKKLFHRLDCADKKLSIIDGGNHYLTREDDLIKLDNALHRMTRKVLASDAEPDDKSVAKPE